MRGSLAAAALVAVAACAAPRGPTGAPLRQVETAEDRLFLRCVR